MTKLACNVVAYRPDPAMLAANFSPWQAEVLLCEAATLLDRCLADLKVYASLDRAWQGYSNDLDILEKEIELDRKRETVEEPAQEAAQEPQAAEAPVEPQPGEEASRGKEQREEQQEAEQRPEEGEGEELREPPAAEITTFLELRAESVRRKRDLAGPGRPYALDEQRDLVLKRVCRDYEEAVNRISVAEDGIRLIYGYDGDPSPLTAWAETLSASITSFSIWTRNTLEWLGKYQRREQAFTRAFSVRALMNRNAWGQLRHARDSFSVKLQVPSELFQGFDNCRLRGVSASLIGEAGTVPWSLILRLPEAALFVREGQKVEVDQSRLPACLLGRVENRRSVRRSEFCGMVSHANASPVGRNTAEGQWSLELFRPTGSATELFAQVDDLIVEIKIAAVPQPQRGDR
ncbi:hypothetical protein Gbem_3872 [Citrifermentans bemidjiense Bem]|uniref:Uncharacterized protein n=1 Tax=Citrifermentans bemidjiense (strain ATCC BAA-1014 / DSM 16622 / JCM 12645 / Bem) TaxID=404380 RepID=B5EFA9_CITBB|nr:hypothetical protein [Citrifermentans bemidjiense]ACH40864.1 hypothetical protein Gbem_3872 [Citrifermentans bemidjiense Bem]